MSKHARALAFALMVWCVGMVGVSHSAGTGPQEVVVKLAGQSLIGASGTVADCADLVRWVAAGAPKTSTPQCQALRGQARTFRLRWSWAEPDALVEWLGAQERDGQLVWFEFAGQGLRTQAAVQGSSADFYARLEPFARSAASPSFVSGEALRLQNLLRIYRPIELVTVAVIDSGVNFDTPGLLPLRFVNSSEVPGNGVDDDGNGYVDDVSGWDFVDDGWFSWFDDTQTPDNDPKDLLGHGTAVARISVATAGPDAATWLRILPLRVASGTNGVGSVSPFALAEAIHYATSVGVNVINLSVGSVQNYQVVTEAIDAAQAQGVQVVVAAGNSSGGVLFPANLPGVLAVGALDANGQIWSGSARGTEVALFLRGTDMLRELGGGISGLAPNGTSYAAPMASAMAAMLWAVSGDCSVPSQTIRQFRPADQHAETWAAALVNQFESDAQSFGNLPGRWEAGERVCGAELTVAGLLRSAAP